MVPVAHSGDDAGRHGSRKRHRRGGSLGLQPGPRGAQRPASGVDPEGQEALTLQGGLCLLGPSPWPWRSPGAESEKSGVKLRARGMAAGSELSPGCDTDWRHRGRESLYTLTLSHSHPRARLWPPCCRSRCPLCSERPAPPSPAAPGPSTSLRGPFSHWLGYLASRGLSRDSNPAVWPFPMSPPEAGWDALGNTESQHVPEQGRNLSLRRHYLAPRSCSAN